MQTTEPPTKVYHPKPTDTNRIAVLSQSNAPVKVYEPHKGISNGIK